MSTFTLIHVALSLVGIGSGFVVMYGLLALRALEGWAALFLLTTLATSVTGFGFPVREVLPSHGVGVISILVLCAGMLAHYAFRRSKRARVVYALMAVLALYFNMFVLVVQAFLKVPALHALAPRQVELPFALAQGMLLAVFAGLAIAVVHQLRKADAPAAAAAEPHSAR